MLVVWLPLNGDTHNQGLSNITVTNNGATVNNNGKIGKCYYFNGSSQYLQLSKSLTNLYAGDFSWAIWLKPTDATRGVIFSEYSSTGSSNVAFELLANRVIRVYWNGSPDWSTGIALTQDIWSHVAITRTGNTLKVYVNGELQATKSDATLANRTSSSYIRLGDDYRGGTSVSYMGYMNDARIYDHALSPKEVEEIAKGLVLHYKLDDRFCEPTTNLVTQLVAGRNITVTNNVIKNTGENADTYWYIKPKEALIGGATYTLSCNCTGFSSSSNYIQFGVGAQSGANYAGSWKIYNGYNTFTFTMPSNLNGSTANFIFDDNGAGTRTQVFEISNVQLEKKDHATGYAGVGGSRTPTTIYDSSGYRNNGTIVGELTAAADSPRYGTATVFNGSSAIKNTDFIFNSSIWTASLWYFKPTMPTKYEILFCLSQNDGGTDTNKKICAAPKDSYIWYKGESGSVSNSNIKINQWCFLTLTCNGTTVTIYENGISKGTFNAGTALTYRTDLVIGARATAEDATTLSTYYTGKISDFRVYATALTATQIQELYNTSMTIDASGTAYVREVVEQ